MTSVCKLDCLRDSADRHEVGDRLFVPPRVVM